MLYEVITQHLGLRGEAHVPDLVQEQGPPVSQLELSRPIGESEAMTRLMQRVQSAAPAATRVLITGENGTGKELVARAIHALSTRSRGPFVEVSYNFV